MQEVHFAQPSPAATASDPPRGSVKFAHDFAYETSGVRQVGSDTRYELLEKIGAGSFATVYRARDNELDREVAVKQIHEHYLDDPEQLERYWQEAQLLASLQHPNIVTIYDIDRERGWLVMELMQGNLGARMSGRQIDLKSLRTAIAQCLRALKYLHARGIVHGDIKPSNMMIDARRRIKLGDFGLARRVSDEDGSLLKGTTKYMAPEVVSDEFGEVGPLSDFYSLGFAAYELMCGPNFESLFPGLSAFGRDKQVAWMMWHAAPDRKLPEIGRVLEGVPEDLAKVVQTLTQKKQSDRYQTVDEALSDLNVDVKVIKNEPANADETEDADAEAEAKKRRMVAIGAFSFSLILCLVMLFMPSGDPAPQGQDDPAAKTSGVVGTVLVDQGILVIEEGPQRIPKEIKLGNDPRILLNNNKYILPRDLQKGDRVTIERGQDEGGRSQLKIMALRADITGGFVKVLQPQLGNFTLEIDEGPNRGELLITVSEDTRITLNGNPATLDELKADDRVKVHHLVDEKNPGARAATMIVAFQDQQFRGFIRDIDAAQGKLTVEARKGATANLITMTFDEKCNVTVNGKQVMDNRLLKPADLKPGDRVTVSHHENIFDVRALRQLRFTGRVLDVRASANSLVVGESQTEQSVFVMAKDVDIEINGRPATLGDLRRNDQADLSYDRTERGSEVTAIDAARPIDKNRLAIIIGNQNYDDVSLTKLPYAVKDAQAIYDTLITRYGCSPEQVLLLKDETRVRLVQAIPDWLKKVTPNSQVLVYFAGHAYLDDENRPFLAAKDFDLKRMSESGVSLNWLREQLEACVAHEKLLLLDSSHAGEGTDLEKQPGAAAVLEALKAPKEPAVFKTTNAIASSQSGQRGLDWDEKQHGMFAYFVSQGFAGAGDKNQDVHLEPTELFDYLKNAMAKVSLDGKTQTPALFVPDDTPAPAPRLSDEAQQVIRAMLAGNWGSAKLSKSIAASFAAAQALVGKEPDAKLAYATLLLKTRDRKQALRYFEQAKFDAPNVLLSYEAAAWIHFEDTRYSNGIPDLVTMCTKICERSKEAGELNKQDQRLLAYAGQLREFATEAADLARRPQAAEIAKLDSLIKRQDADIQKRYQQGRDLVTAAAKSFDDQIKNASTSKAKLLELDRKRIIKYTSFDFENARKSILAGLAE